MGRSGGCGGSGDGGTKCMEMHHLFQRRAYQHSRDKYPPITGAAEGQVKWLPARCMAPSLLLPSPSREEAAPQALTAGGRLVAGWVGSGFGLRQHQRVETDELNFRNVLARRVKL